MKTRSCSFLLLLATITVSAQTVTTPADIPTKAFAQLPVMRSARISPDGANLAYIRPIEGRGHLVIQPLLEAGQPFVAPPTGDAEYDWLRWANNELLVFSISATRKRGTIETSETRLWSVKQDGSGATHIVLPSRRAKTGSGVSRDLPPAQLQGNVIHWLPDEPNHILLSLDGDHNAANEVRRIDVRDGTYDLVRRDASGIQNWLTDQSGELRFGWGFRSSNLKTLTLDQNGKWRSAEKAEWWDADYFPLGFTAAPDIAYVRGPDERGYKVIRTMSISSGELSDIVFARDGIDVGSLVDDPLTQQPVGVTYIDDFRKIHYFDESLAALQKALDKALPETANEIVSMTGDRRKVLVYSSSDIDAGTYAYLDRDENSLSIIAEAMPGLPPELMSEVEPVSYAARDGLEIPAYLTVPRASARENLRVVVMPHGGPSARDDRSFWFLSQFLAARGYAVFQPNFRGSTGYGKDFEDAGRSEWGGKMQEDVTDGVHWLVEQGIANPDKLCIVGWSYGGYSAAIGAVQTPDLYQCAASINGVLDLPRLIADDRHYIGGTAWTKHIGLEGENAKLVSPYHQAERITIPMLIIQAQDDARVHEDQGKRMARILDRQKKPVTYVDVELGGHSMTNEAARVTILQSLEEFLDQNLSDD
ncbi:MAG: alpha/beta hydrolase family protein [Woeseiaceae bacterium]